MSVPRSLRVLAALVLLSLLPAVAVAAGGPSVTLYRIDVTQYPSIVAYVSVANGEGVPIQGLPKQSFEVLQDDKPIADFEATGTVNIAEPVAVALVIDVSGSMEDEGRMPAAKAAATSFVESMRDIDSAAVVTFSDQVSVVQPFTKDRNALKAAIGKLAPKGDTALYDAIAQGSQLLAKEPTNQRKLVMVLSDGEDTKSSQTLDASIAAAKAGGSPVLVVGLGGGVKRDILDKVASATGGQAIYVAKSSDLGQVFANLGDRLRYQYVVKYKTTLVGDDKQHNLTVRAKDRDQVGEAKGTFLAKKTTLVFDVKGLTDLSKVAGTVPVEVTVTQGTAQQAELLVDDKARATATGSPFKLGWDTTKETPGLHRVTVRVKDPAGNATDKLYTVDVQAPATAAPSPAASPTPGAGAATPAVGAKATAVAQITPTVAPTPTPPPRDDTLLYAGIGLGGLVVVGLIALGIYLLVRRKPQLPAIPVEKPKIARFADDDTKAMFGSPEAPARPPAALRQSPVAPPAVTPPVAVPPIPVPPVAAPVVAPVAAAESDKTELAGALDAGATVVHGPPPPRARLHIVHQGAERDVLVEAPGTVVGRESTNPIVIRDPMASRRHAQIVVENGEFWVEDLKSLNGTKLNGEPLTARRKLHDNDQIKIGDALLTFTTEPS